MCGMTARGSRGVVLAAAALAAFALAAAPAWAASGGARPSAGQALAARLGPIRSGNGIVQAVRAHAVVVRLLDGRRLVVPVGPRTVVVVNGLRSSLAAVQPGFVVSFTDRDRRPAINLRANGPSSGNGSTAAKPGSVQSVSGGAVVVAAAGGGTTTVAVGARTQVFLNGAPAPISAIAVGDRLVKVRGDATGRRPAHALRFRRPG
jgi:hypothetical protein